eukprot:12541971-Ditylum_brightwellii.AAC.1
MQLTLGYVLKCWLKKAGSKRIWMEIVLTSVDSGWGNNATKALNIFQGADWDLLGFLLELGLKAL